MEDFCLNHSMSHLIKEPTCYKSLENPTCIDLILTNFPKSFQNSMSIETGLSDFHKMTVTVMKSHYKKQNPKIIKYRRYIIREVIKTYNPEHMTLDTIKQEFIEILNKLAPIKHRYIRANQAPFMNKSLNKSVMDRSRLKN